MDSVTEPCPGRSELEQWQKPQPALSEVSPETESNGGSGPRQKSTIRGSGSGVFYLDTNSKSCRETRSLTGNSAQS